MVSCVQAVGLAILLGYYQEWYDLAAAGSIFIIVVIWIVLVLAMICETKPHIDLTQVIYLVHIASISRLICEKYIDFALSLHQSVTNVSLDYSENTGYRFLCPCIEWFMGILFLVCLFEFPSTSCQGFVIQSFLADLLSFVCLYQTLTLPIKS